MTPRLDGLREALPPNRARRAVELVAYLALHQPDVITGDRLRRRVLGSSDADAASKTLFNTAYAARRAMGLDQLGSHLFPAGTRNGLYQVSPLVTVDVNRAIALVEVARSQPEADLAIAHYRARSSWSRASLWPTPCRAIRGGRPRVTGGGLPPYSSTPPAPWQHWRPVRGISTSPGGVSNVRAWSSPTARHSHAPQCSSLPPRGMQTGSASNGESAAAASTRWTPAAHPRHAPSLFMASSAGGSCARAEPPTCVRLATLRSEATERPPRHCTPSRPPRVGSPGCP